MDALDAFCTSGSSPPEFLTVDEAAALLRVNRKTLYEAIQRHEVPGVVRVRKAIRLRRSAVMSWSTGQGGPALKKEKA